MRSQLQLCLLAGPRKHASLQPMGCPCMPFPHPHTQRVSPSAGPLPAGYREAAEAARQQLVAIATDNGKDPEAFRRDLVNIAKTTLSSKILTQGGWVCMGVRPLGHNGFAAWGQDGWLCGCTYVMLTQAGIVMRRPPPRPLTLPPARPDQRPCPCPCPCREEPLC